MNRHASKAVVLILAGVVAFHAAQAAVGDVVASAVSEQMFMDTASCSVDTAVITVGRDAKPVPVSYSGRTWHAGTDMGTASLYDNDVLVGTFSCEGWAEYVPPTAGTHALSLRVAHGPTLRRTFMVEVPALSIARGADPAINGGIPCAITSPAAGATIYFTTDGSEPTTESRVYTGPFAINPDPSKVTMVKAFCVVSGWPRSDTAMKLLMPAENMELVSSSDAVTTSLDMRAGTGTLESKGSETIVWSGLWAADSNAEVTVTLDGAPFVAGRGEGIETWTPVGGGTHTFRHMTAGSDEVLVATFSVDVVVEIDGKTVTVPGLWLLERTQRTAMDMAANGRAVWACYVLGLDPENGDATNDFRIVSFPMKADGTPDVANLGFDPPQAQWNVPGARAVVKGAERLEGEWKAVEGASAEEKAAMRFFKVVVELP